MSVAYEDAMNTLTGMFPDLSRDTIDRTLSDCNYHLERTVEALLSAGTAPEIIEQPGTVPTVRETEFETLEERRDLMLAIQLQRDEDLTAKRLKAAEAEELRQNPSRKEHIIPYDYQSAEYSDEEDANADNEPELINLDEIADKITEFGEAARQKFKFFASKFQSLIGDSNDKNTNPSPNVEYKSVASGPSDVKEKAAAVDSEDSEDEPTLIDRRALRKSQATTVGSSIVLREDKKDK
eukprot:TRINITY_DN7356_c0_g1_i1.p1 TRINITY_DN7356_c0_g1~~TRINITY_DN7356_c0_g1_i1.p1  ORF type:complete len:238 (-),score=65.58 TRINITY_DN7356_c0_g1_i1:243-956(-)